MNEDDDVLRLVSSFTPEAMRSPVMVISTVYSDEREECPCSTKVFFTTALNGSHGIGRVFGEEPKVVREMDSLHTSEGYTVTRHSSRDEAWNFFRSMVDEMDKDVYESLLENHVGEDWRDIYYPIKRLEKSEEENEDVEEGDDE